MKNQVSNAGEDMNTAVLQDRSEMKAPNLALFQAILVGHGAADQLERDNHLAACKVHLPLLPCRATC